MSTTVQKKYSDTETTTDDTATDDPTMSSNAKEEPDTATEPKATIAGAEVDDNPPPLPDPKSDPPTG